MYEYKAKLTKIIDSDTVEVDIDLGLCNHMYKTVSLSGIKVPNSKSRDDEEKQRGLAAKQRLLEMLEQAKYGEFILRTEIDNHGKYTRILGTIIIGGMNVNKTLVQEGLAIDTTGGNR